MCHICDLISFTLTLMKSLKIICTQDATKILPILSSALHVTRKFFILFSSTGIWYNYHVNSRGMSQIAGRR